MLFKTKINKNDSVLLKSQKIQYFTDQKADFIYSQIPQVIKDIEDELEELKAEIKLGQSNKQRILEELGDVIFSLCNLANRLEINAEDALEYTNNEFQRRFNFIEKKLEQEKIELKKAGLQKLIELWKEAKKSK
jgi:uncharacterized protein YabN with tetrapyrrole methylase and pyrophosphatase domain